MLKELVKLANHLDNLGHADLADQLDSVIKMAQTLTPDDPRVDKQVNKIDAPAAQDTKAMVSSKLDRISTLLSEVERLAPKDADFERLKDKLFLAMKTPEDSKDYKVWVAQTLRKIKALAERAQKSEMAAEIEKTLTEISVATTGTDLEGKLVETMPETAPAAKAESAAPQTVSQAVVDGILTSGRGLVYPAEASATGPVHEMQKLLKVTADGKFGKNTLTAFRGVMGASALPLTDANGALSALKAKLTPASVAAPAAATTAPSAPAPAAAPAAAKPAAPAAVVAPSVDAPVGTMDLEKLLTERRVKPQVVNKLMRMLARGVLGEFSALNPRTIAGQQQKVKRILTNKGIAPDEADQIVSALSGLASQKFVAPVAKTSGLSDSEERIQKIAESLEDLSFDFSKVTHSVRR